MNPLMFLIPLDGLPEMDWKQPQQALIFNTRRQIIIDNLFILSFLINRFHKTRREIYFNLHQPGCMYSLPTKEADHRPNLQCMPFGPATIGIETQDGEP
jgi:hypothetical protein